MGEGGGSRGSVQVTSGDSSRMRWILSQGGEKIMLLIAAAKSWSMREAYNWPVFMEEDCVQTES